MCRHVFIVIEAYVEELVGDGTVQDEDLNRVLLSEDFAKKLCSCICPKKIEMLREKIFAGTDAQIVTRLRTYMRDLCSVKHVECHGFQDTDDTRAIARWMAHRVYLASPVWYSHKPLCKHRSIRMGSPCVDSCLTRTHATPPYLLDELLLSSTHTPTHSTLLFTTVFDECRLTGAHNHKSWIQGYLFVSWSH